MPDFSKIGKSNVRRSKAHERRVAKLLTEWSGIEFRRRRVEGREGDVVDIERTADVIPATPDWSRFSIEAKCGEWGTFDALMTNPKITTFTEWWHQANYDADLATKSYHRLNPDEHAEVYPLIFFKPHKNFDWLAISKKALSYIVPKDSDVCYGGTALWFPTLIFDHYENCGPISHNIVHTKNKKNMKFVPLQLHGCVFCRWKDFAQHVHPRSFFLSWPVVGTKPENSE
jgi:hypothetical protein